MALPPIDQALRDAIDKLADIYGEVDAETVDNGLIEVLDAFAHAAVEDRVPEGILFDANHERRVVEFQLAFTNVLAEVLDGLPANVPLRQGDTVYRVGYPRSLDDLGRGHRSLVRGNKAVIGMLEEPADEIVGRYHWASLEQQIQLVTDREWVLEAKAQALASRTAAAPQSVSQGPSIA